MTRALIADDEPNLAEHLRGRLAQLWPELEILPLAANGLEALRALDEDEPEVAFLDIRMPGLSGLEVAGRSGHATHVVFVTAYDQYAVEAFDREAADYVLKPVTDERLEKCIERLKKKLAAAERPPALDDVLARIARAIPGAAGGKLRWIRASKGEVVRQIAVDDVLYFQASDKYTCVMTREGESLIRLPLAELADQLDPEAFAQIHRGTIVNLREVASTRRDLGGRTFVMLRDGKTELPVSRAYAPLFKQM
ncbi:LytR/AlgR family response regulator transcription factor [Usitatibacter palustris]|uniref:Transcriptional regulatory protein BtsR n=1 Tax=Usitatibacter palustris TaxID=2732487 RepID=A0A6M4H5W4_9PROT|nr:LytTR family DNA-binding domain-containing protein [Usitatibacter palustris]QJR13297.1 Transcriptional regulatory protein BtsR [Usitatibacter palustris]